MISKTNNYFEQQNQNNYLADAVKKGPPVKSLPGRSDRPSSVIGRHESQPDPIGEPSDLKTLKTFIDFDHNLSDCLLVFIDECIQ